jgi:hypothetical protein
VEAGGGEDDGGRGLGSKYFICMYESRMKHITKMGKGDKKE